MNKLFLPLFAFVLLAASANAQIVTPTVKWKQCYGGSISDYMASVKPTPDKGFVMVGYIESNDSLINGSNHGSSDIWVVKTDSDGKVQWSKALGGNDAELATDIQLTKDGGYIIAGSTESFPASGNVTGSKGASDAWIVKLRSGGQIQWTRCYGGINDELAKSIVPTIDGGYIFAGSSTKVNGDVTGTHGNSGATDFWVVKTDSEGYIKWEKSYGGESGDDASSIWQTKDYGYIVSGTTISNDSIGDVTRPKGSEDIWVIKINSSGVLQWQKTLGGTGSDFATEMLPTNDGGYIVAGNSGSADSDVTASKGKQDYWLVKLDDKANIAWQKSYGGFEDEFLKDMERTSDGGYFLTGYSTSTQGDVGSTKGAEDYWVIKLDSNGLVHWKKTWGGTSGDIASTGVQTHDGGYAVGGYSYSNDIDLSGNNGEYDYWVLRLTPDGSAPIGSNSAINIAETINATIYPNPSQGQFFIKGTSLSKVEIFDAVGKLVGTSSLTGDNSSQGVNVQYLPNGVYFARVYDNSNQSATVKIMVQQ